MKNPFIDFRPDSYQVKESSASQIIRAKQNVMDGIIAGYIQMVEEEINELAWVVEHKRVVKAYGAAIERIRDFRFDQADIEEFCAELDGSNSIPYMIPGPAGLYVSALVNYSQENHIFLKLKSYQRTFHFLGYGLPKGKTLTLIGDGGDFTGTGLNGGCLEVKGSAGNWCGAGMLKGEILVSKHTGQNTGEWMQGGEIRVDGQIRNIGSSIFGGCIYQQGRLIASQKF